MVELPAQIGVEAGFPHVGPPAGIDPVEDVPAPDELHHHVRVELRHLRRAHRRPGRAPVQLLVIGARVPDRAAQRDATAHPAGVVQRDEKAGKGEEADHAQQGAARPGIPAWYSSIAVTAAPRIPSRAGTWCKPRAPVGAGDGAGGLAEDRAGGGPVGPAAPPDVTAGCVATVLPAPPFRRRPLPRRPERCARPDVGTPS